jgi:methylthioribose-1-phosphate isomerase
LIDFSKICTVRWKNGKVILIDQRALPHRLSTLECKDYREVVEAIRNMAVRGAPAIGVAAAMGIALAAYNSKRRGKRELLRAVNSAAKSLKLTRPTGSNLFWAIDRMLKKVREPNRTAEEISAALLEEARNIVEEDFQANLCIGEIGAALLEDGDVVLTHCN